MPELGVLNLELGKKDTSAKGWQMLWRPSFSRSGNSARELVCESGSSTDKKAESTGEVVGKTKSAGARGFSPNIKRLKVSFSHTTCLDSSWPTLGRELVRLLGNSVWT